MQMKNVAGFHSLDFIFFLMAERGEVFRRGLGIMFSQKDFWSTLVAGELELANFRRGMKSVLRKVGGARSMRRSIVDLFITADSGGQGITMM